MRSCKNCFCRPICRIELGAVSEKFSKPGSLDELEKLWQELASKCKYWKEKREMKTGETKYCSKCRQMIKAIGETCLKCGRALYHIYQKIEKSDKTKKLLGIKKKVPLGLV